MNEDVWQELSALGGVHDLVEHGDYWVIHARGEQIPRSLIELGRCRARTFHAAGMGSGAELDLDGYDRDYTQLIMVDRRRRQLVGGYRIARCRELMRLRGVAGIYGASLFDFDASFTGALHGAVELGRSFICPEYQRQLRPLALLWQGVGAFMAQRPREDYVLFGSVSVPATMSVASRMAILDHLRTHHYDPALAAGVVARTPPSLAVCAEAPSESLAELERRLRANEPGARVPILIKRYLQLGGRFIGFNQDAGFGDSLDCLVWVDLRQTSARRLRAYVGEETQRVLQGLEPAQDCVSGPRPELQGAELAASA